MREVDQHDAVLLDDADQQDDADHGDQAEIEAEQHQRGERADARRRQRRQDRDRVDVALVEDAEDQVDDDERGHDQHRHGGERLLERLRVALEACVCSDGGSSSSRSACLIASVAVPSAAALGQIEADGDRRELALVADRQRLGLLRRPLGEGRERHLLPGRRRLGRRSCRGCPRIALQLRQDLHDDVVAVLLREILRHLALAEGVIQRVVDHAAASARSARPDRDRWSSVSVVPDICWSVATSRSSGSVLSLSSTLGAHVLSSSMSASCSVYWNCVRAARPPTLTSCAACRKSLAPSTFSSLRPQPRDDLVGGGVALVLAASA